MRYRYRELTTRGQWRFWSKSISHEELQKKIDQFKDRFLVAFQYQDYTQEDGKLIDLDKRNTQTLIHPYPERVINGEVKSWKQKTKKLFETMTKEVQS